MPTRLRKVRRLRSSRTHGFGQVGQHRHSGKQGGHGNAGLHKHKWSWLIKNDPLHFRRDPFRPPGYEKVSAWINVGDLEAIANGSGQEGPVLVDLSAMGFQKLLGSGIVRRAYNVKVAAWTERARAKVEGSGGKIITGPE